VILPAPPTRSTLAKYGLTADDWRRLCAAQGCVCPVCLQPFGDRKLVVDHEHVRGFRAHRRPLKGRTRERRMMSQQERRRHVRGILHAWCNGLVRRWLTLERAAAILKYLEAHEERKR
jgi:hypothetical protein